MEHHETPEAQKKEADEYVHPSIDALRALDSDSPEFEEMTRKIIERDFEEDLYELAKLPVFTGVRRPGMEYIDPIAETYRMVALEYLVGKKLAQQWTQGAEEISEIPGIDQYIQGVEEIIPALQDAQEALGTGLRKAQSSVIDRLFPED